MIYNFLHCNVSTSVAGRAGRAGALGERNSLNKQLKIVVLIISPIAPVSRFGYLCPGFKGFIWKGRISALSKVIFYIVLQA